MSKKKLKKNKELKNSTLSKVAFGFVIVPFLYYFVIFFFPVNILSFLGGGFLDSSMFIGVLALVTLSGGILGVVSLFKKGYKKTLAIISLSICGFPIAVYLVILFMSMCSPNCA